MLKTQTNCSMQRVCSAFRNSDERSPRIARSSVRKERNVLRTGKQELVWGSVSGHWPPEEWIGGCSGLWTP